MELSFVMVSFTGWILLSVGCNSVRSCFERLEMVSVMTVGKGY